MKVVIVGAGSVGSSIARELLAHKHEILLIDEKPEVIGRSGLRGAHWLVGDACELSTLQDAKLEGADVVVSATGDDKVNLVVSLLAQDRIWRRTPRARAGRGRRRPSRGPHRRRARAAGDSVRRTSWARLTAVIRPTQPTVNRPGGDAERGAELPAAARSPACARRARCRGARPRTASPARRRSRRARRGPRG